MNVSNWVLFPCSCGSKIGMSLYVWMVYNMEILCNYWIQLLHRSLAFQVIHGRVLALSRNPQSHQLNCRCSSKTNTFGLVWPTFPQDGYIILMGDWSWNCQRVHFEAVLDLKQAQQVGFTWDSLSGRHLKQDGNLGCGEWFFCRMWVSGRSPPGKLKLRLKITQLKTKVIFQFQTSSFGFRVNFMFVGLAERIWQNSVLWWRTLGDSIWLEIVFFPFDMCEISHTRSSEVMQGIIQSLLFGWVNRWCRPFRSW